MQKHNSKVKSLITNNFEFLLARLQRLMRSICGQVFLSFDF
jgi:hypothetical protein